MSHHLLLDLDGTLLGIRMEEFIPVMVASMRDHFREAVDGRLFVEALQTGFSSMMASQDGDRTVLQVFLREFCRMTSLGEEETQALFSGYYRVPFRGLSRLSRPVAGARELLEQAGRHGIMVTLATNPIFPLEAIRVRIGWAGLEAYPFALITAAEVMHACKPSPAYYRETLELLKAAPGECLMAGNDRHQDLAAGEVGIRTFLVTEGFQTGRDSGQKPDHHGTLADLTALLDKWGQVLKLEI